ncbi:MAG: flippase-like domain-containing protein [Chitinispirillales bacterium]|nr:flippase-like domain-containing protein [Chitinispirillales bacterium]
MKSKEVVILSAKILATFFLFFYVNKNVDFSQIHNIEKLGFVFFIAVTFGFIQQFFLFLRWYFSLKILNISVSKKSILKSYFVGQFLGTITPARSGDLAKAFYLENTDKKHGTYAVILDGAIAMLTLFFIGGAVFYLCLVGFFSNGITDVCQNNTYFTYRLSSAAGILCVLLVVVSIILIAIIIISSKTKLSANFFTDFIKLFSVSILQNAALIIQAALIFNLLLPVSLDYVLYRVSIAYCVMPFLSITIASIGVREWAFTALFCDEIIAFAVSYILLLCNSVIFMIPGIFLFYFNGKKI